MVGEEDILAREVGAAFFTVAFVLPLLYQFLLAFLPVDWLGVLIFLTEEADILRQLVLLSL